MAANVLIGYAVDRGGWDAGFSLITGACVLAIILTALTIRAEYSTHRHQFTFIITHLKSADVLKWLVNRHTNGDRS